MMRQHHPALTTIEHGAFVMATRNRISKPVQCQCRECGADFVYNAAEVLKGRGQFCTRRCSARYAQRVRWEAEKTTLADRYWSHVIKRGEDECWGWSAFKYKGYGRLSNGGKTIGAHRVSYMIHEGPIDGGLTVLHRCDNPECTNPRHLFLGTNADNNADRDRKGRQARGERDPRSVLNERMVLQLRQAKREGQDVTALARTMGINPNTASAAVTGRSWKHLP
jgi:hypothetical protein